MQGSSGSALNHNQILVTSPDLDTTPRWSPGQPASGRRVGPRYYWHVPQIVPAALQHCSMVQHAAEEPGIEMITDHTLHRVMGPGNADLSAWCFLKTATLQQSNKSSFLSTSDTQSATQQSVLLGTARALLLRVAAVLVPPPGRAA